MCHGGKEESGQAALEVALALPALVLAAALCLEAANVALTHFAAEGAARAAARALVASAPQEPDGATSEEAARDAASSAASWHGTVGADDIGISWPEGATETTYTHHLWSGTDVEDALSSSQDVKVSVTVHKGWATALGPLWYAAASAAGGMDGVEPWGMACTATKVVVVDLTAAKSIGDDGEGVTDWDKYVS